MPLPQFDSCPLCGGTVRAGECQGECSNTPESSLLSRALMQVESASIRAWATTAHNRPLWLKYCAGTIAGAKPREPNIHTLAAFIVACAIGL